MDEAFEMLRNVRLPFEGATPDPMREAMGVQLPPLVLSEYIPKSWFHPKGIRKVLRDLEPRLPEVSGRLFLTFTVDPKLFANPSSAYDYSRGKLRKVFYALRKGIDWEGRNYAIRAPYCVKTEFHENGWAHFHVLFLTRRFVPAELIAALWGIGRINIKRISGNDFRYLLKYITKGGNELPQWVQDRRRMRIFQPSHGFITPELSSNTKASEASLSCRNVRRESLTIRERIRRWARMAKLSYGDRARTFPLIAPFRQLFDELIFSIARAGHYLGSGKIVIKQAKELIPWTMKIVQTRDWYYTETDSSCGEWSFPIQRPFSTARTGAV